MSNLLRCGAIVAAMFSPGASEDGFALLQQSVAPHAASETSVEQMLSQNKALIDMAPQMAQLMDDLTPADYVKTTIQSSKEHGQGPELKDKLAQGWKAFHQRSLKANTSDPHAMLETAKLALLETGAMQEMRQLALAASNATKESSRGAVPLDSMMVGFRTSVAPWNNLLRMLGMPLVKASFTIFTNFFGPYATGARLCIGAQTAADSTYGVHTRSEFGGINVWIGPAKWDNVPGWSFGTSGGVDDVPIWDVSDFGWTWTLAKVPETVGFHWDVLLIDDETLHAGMLQTGSELKEEKSSHINRHGSTWIQHVWCSPHWINTPLVIPDDKPATVTAKAAPAEAHKQVWDPETEAV